MSGVALGQTSSGGGGTSGGLTNTELRAAPVPVTDDAQDVLIGAVTEAAPATDTASSGTNGRLQRVAQRITSLIALLPASLGQKTMAGSLAVTLASDQSALSVTSTNGLTDTQLRATPVPVSGTVSTGGLTDAQLRASAVPVDTELPAAAALADAAANPTAPAVGAFHLLWNGATWDRAPGSASKGATVTPSAEGLTTGTLTAAAQSVTAPVTPGSAGLGISIYGTFSAFVGVWEWSPDGGATYGSLALSNSSVASQAAVNTGAINTGVSSYRGEIPGGATHIRLRCSAITSGTANVILAQSVMPRHPGPGQPNINQVSSLVSLTPGTAATNLGKAEDAAAASGDTGVFVLGVRNDTQATSTSTDGDYIQQSHDARGAQRVNPASFAFANISTSTTTTVKSGAGDLHSITINNKGTVASTITVFDNTAGSGTKIATIDSLNLEGTLVYDVAFATGLTLVTTGTVAPDATVSFR